MVVATMLIGFILVSFQWVGAVGPGAHRVTNLTNKAFTVSWTSEALEAGTIEWGTTVGLGNVSIDDRGAVSGRTHHVTVGGLLPATTYFYDVVSGSATDDNEGAHFTVTTGPTLGGPGSDLAYGKVFRSDGLAGAPGCLVYVQVQDADGQGSAGSSLFFSALSEGSGLDVYWNINLGTVREQGGASFFTYAGDDTTAVEVDCGGQASVSLSVPTSDDSPAPDVVVASASDPGPTLTPTPVSSPSPTFAPPPPGSLGGGGAAAATPTPVSTVNMGVAITGWPETISAGGEVTFGVVVTNNGGKSATDIVVTNSLPLRAHFTSGTPDCIESRSSVVTCKVDFLNPGDEARMSISFLASATAVPGTTLTNLATVTSTQPDSDPSDNAVAVS
ncbi:MAG: hypothetical protein O3B84_05765, partial [Chloroflexi bacterium]|nr:hypothetical protein [Chloroflexota bacterium]